MFVHLHVHTEYSLLDGLCRIPHLVKAAKEAGMNSLAITDHGNMHGIIDFYREAQSAGIKPIIGCEVYVAQTKLQSKTASDKSPYHLTLLARNDEGYHNLIQLVTKAHLEGFYYKPRVDRELLSAHREGLIALSGCAQGHLSRLILEGRYVDATKEALHYKDIFEHYYVEIQRHPIPELVQINEGLLSLAAELDLPLVATNDVHYINRDDAHIHDILICIQTNTTIHDEKRLKMAGDFFYLKSPQEMEELYKDVPKAIENTQVIADMCELELDFGKTFLPKVEVPDDKTADEYLLSLCWEGFKRRYPSPWAELETRLSYELDVIRQTNFADYFLVVWDLISFTREQNILFGVRGSAAASLALYCLGITDIDPIANKLVFERFLNVERREMPDIDLDFQDDRRDELITYVNKKYGTDHVAQIITFGTLGARAALRDAGRALGMPYSQVDQVARLIPVRPNVKLEDALQESREFYNAFQEDDTIRNLVNTARKLEGISRHSSTHAAGIVISREPLAHHIPLQRATKDSGEATAMTQLSMENVARLGLLKLDFLGLANLTLLAKAIEIIARDRGVLIDLHQLPLDDRATYELLASGETSGIFQLEGDGMRRYIKELKPTTFTDISAMIALYRPGPMEHIPTFIKAKYGIEPIRYPHPALEKLLEETYGVIVYQDQVLLIVQALAGYSLGQADIFRKAMGKKIARVMQQERQNFIVGAADKGLSETQATEIFDLIEPFAGYAFNKAHSVSYALIAYQTAYLKANYPVEYMTAFLNTYASNSDKIRSAIAECRRLGIMVLPPDINRSEAEFAIENIDGKSAIRYGLTAIKNVGAGAVEPILSARKQGGVFESIDDFYSRADLRSVNKKVLESLIKAGSFECFATREALLLAIHQIVSLSQREHQLKESGQVSMFNLWGSSDQASLPGLSLENIDSPVKDKLEWEKELLGVYFSEHPLASAMATSGNTNATLCGHITTDMAGEKVIIAGMVTSVRHITTQNGRPGLIATMEDIEGPIEVTAWNHVCIETRDLWQEGELLLVEGTVKSRDERVSVNCRRASKYQANPDAVPEPNPEPQHTLQQILIINVYETEREEEDVMRLQKIMATIKRYPGNDIAQLLLIGEEKTTLELPGVTRCLDLEQELSTILGHNSIDLRVVE